MMEQSDERGSSPRTNTAPRMVLSSTVVRRQTVIRAGAFCPVQRYGEDWTFLVNVGRLCDWHTIPQRLGFYRLHPRQDTRNPGAGLFRLATRVNAWYTGRPLRHPTGGLEFLSELAAEGPVYRIRVQRCYWEAVRRRQFHLAHLIAAAGRLLLPRTRDYLYVFLPRRLTRRWEQYVLNSANDRR